jgi:hypothetical protein
MHRSVVVSVTVDSVPLHQKKKKDKKLKKIISTPNLNYDPFVVQSADSRYNDYATLAPKFNDMPFTNFNAWNLF